MNINKKLGLRRGHSFNLPYSLELIFDFSEKPIWGVFHSFFLIPDIWYQIPDIWISEHLDIWISGYLDIWILVTIPTPDFCVVHSWQGPFFSKNNTSLILLTSFK